VGWVAAGELLIGDAVDQADGGAAVVISSIREEHSEGIAVYNFEVEGDHTYFVEDGRGKKTAIWVHNACAGVLGRALGGKAIMHALGYEAHHLVPKSLSKFPIAKAVRDHLVNLGLDVDKAYNGVWLKRAFHRTIHTRKYFDELAKRLLPLNNKNDVIDELGNIAWELMDDTFPYK
jgi:hypothetical protein